MKTRMQPIGNAWQKLPRIGARFCPANSASRSNWRCNGADTELDRQVLDLIKGSAHPYGAQLGRSRTGKPRPSVPPPGKPRAGHHSPTRPIHEGGTLIICIADNGRGLNTERIKAQGGGRTVSSARPKWRR